MSEAQIPLTNQAVAEDWLLTIKPEFREVAKRHGQQVFLLVMQMGATNYAMGLVAQQGRGNRKIMEALGVLQKNLDQLATRLLELSGATKEGFFACKGDVERVAALLDVGGGLSDRVSKGGIILNS